MAVTPPDIPRALEFPGLAEPTEPPSGWAVLAVPAFALLSLWCHFVANQFGIPVLYSALFAVHEAGHVVIGLFSQVAGVYGGTLFQLLFPLLFIHHAARRGQLTAVAASGVWLGESLLNMAAYMADARARLLPLVGFTDEPGHDWEIIFSRWGVLQHDLLIANLARGLALLVMALAVGWLLLRWRSAGHDD
jgi:hypothetical protein